MKINLWERRLTNVKQTRQFKKFLMIIICGIFYGMTMSIGYALGLTENSPIGFWKTIDDRTGETKSIIQIFEAPDKTLQGKVIKLFSEKNNERKLCTICSGDKRNQPIVGMLILTGLKADNNNDSWKDGIILDPKNGKNYKCLAKLTDNGLKLNIRGFIGVSLLGRTQTWERVG